MILNYSLGGGGGGGGGDAWAGPITNTDLPVRMLIDHVKVTKIVD